MTFSIIVKILFVYMLAVQTANMVVGPEFHSILLFKFTLFEIGIISALLILLLRTDAVLKNYSKEVNSFIIAVVILYFVYQIIVIAPLLYIDNNSIKVIAYQILRRSYLLLIPFFYWWVFPSFNGTSVPLKILNYTALILLGLLLHKYFFLGYSELTSTGEIRVAQGNSSILFVLVLVANFALFNGEKTNFLFVAIALIGIILSNHKSAYLGLIVITILALTNSNYIRNKGKIALHILLFIFVVLIPLSQIPTIKDNVIGRLTNTFIADDPNASDRLEHYALAWSNFQEHPINGSKQNHKYYKEKSHSNVPPHNFIFQILATQGIVGFVAISTLIFFLLRLGFINRKDPITFQMALLIIYYLIFTMFNENFFSPRNIILLNFAAGGILYRNACIENAKRILDPILSEQFEEYQNRKDKSVSLDK